MHVLKLRDQNQFSLLLAAVTHALSGVALEFKDGGVVIAAKLLRPYHIINLPPNDSTLIRPPQKRPS